MKNCWESYGAAFRGGRLMAARVVNDGVRSTVTALLTSDDKPDCTTLDSGQLIFNVREDQAVIKNFDIKTDSSIKADDLVRFELYQALLEPPERYYFDAFPIGEKNGYQRYLTIAYHRREIDRQIQEYTRCLRKPSGFSLDSIALARGYLTFCKNREGELQILLDIDRDGSIMTFLFKDSIYSIDRLKTIAVLDDNKSVSELAREITMTLAFQSARLYQDGILNNPEKLILSGRLGDNQRFFDSLQAHLNIELVRPEFNLENFQPAEETINKYSPTAFLIPLGLAVV